jgi:hypothetical protein
MNAHLPPPGGFLSAKLGAEDFDLPQILMTERTTYEYHSTKLLSRDDSGLFVGSGLTLYFLRGGGVSGNTAPGEVLSVQLRRASEFLVHVRVRSYHFSGTMRPTRNCMATCGRFRQAHQKCKERGA